METLIAILLLIVGLGVAGLYAFVKKKMEGLATKTDLEETTRIVEEIQSEVHVRTSGELYMIDQQRTAIIEFHSFAHRCESLVFNTDVVAEVMADDAKTYFKSLDDIRKEMGLAQGRLSFFITDEQIIKAARSLSWKLTISAVVQVNDLNKLRTVRFESRNKTEARETKSSIWRKKWLSNRARLSKTLMKR